MKKRVFVFAALVMALMVNSVNAQLLKGIKNPFKKSEKTEVTKPATKPAMNLSEKSVVKTDSVKTTTVVKSASVSKPVPSTQKPATKKPVARPVSKVWINANEKIISGFKPELKGMTQVQITALRTELAEFVRGKNPAEQMVEVVGLTDNLGWQNLPRSQWTDADTALGEKRAATVQRIYQDELNFEARQAGVKTGTPYRGVLIRLVKYQESEKNRSAIQKDTIREKSTSVEKTTIVKIDTSVMAELKKINLKLDTNLGDIEKRTRKVEISVDSAHHRITALEKAKPKFISNLGWNLELGYSYWNSGKCSLRAPTLGLVFSKPNWVFQTGIGYLPNQIIVSESVYPNLGLVNPVIGSMFGWRLNANDQWIEKTVSGLVGFNTNQNLGPLRLDLTVGVTYGKIWTLSNQQWKPGLFVGLKGGLR